VSARVDELTILVPPGPSGLVGFAFVHSGQQIIPFADGEFVVADGEVIRWPLDRFPDGRGWIVRTYNEDVYDHTLFVRFLLTEGSTSGGATLLTVEDDTIMLAGVTS
jgi:hypothetical protein